MNRFSPMQAGVLVLSLAALALACSNDPSAVSNDTTAQFATFEAGSVQSVVVQSDEYDTNLDGNVERLIVTTTHYDVHGNALEVEDESFVQGARVYHETTTNEYNQHGDLIGFVNEYYDRGSDVAIIRYVMSTIEADKQGHPLRQRIAEDLEADGTFEYSFEQSNQFDSRGRLIMRNTAQQTDHYQYDQHDNVARHEMRWAQANRVINLLQTTEWSVHDVVVGIASTSTQSSQPQSDLTLTSVAFDGQSYPTVQNLDRYTGGQLSSEATIELTYDGRHRVLGRVFSEDNNLDGGPDYRLTTRYDYSGPEVPAAHGVAGTPSAGLAGLTGSAALSRGMDKGGPDGPIGGRFSR